VFALSNRVKVVTLENLSNLKVQFVLSESAMLAPTSVRPSKCIYRFDIELIFRSFSIVAIRLKSISGRYVGSCSTEDSRVKESLTYIGGSWSPDLKLSQKKLLASNSVMLPADLRL
jgi:hypothetical protein